MGLFSSKGYRHIDGHKELTKDKEIISLVTGENMPEKVYFPTMAVSGKPVTVAVKPGDKVKVGTKIGQRSDFEVPVYSSVSGEVLENEMIFSPAIGRPIAHVVIKNDGKYEQVAPLNIVKLSDEKEAIQEAIKLAGIEGMGGAGFPSYVKYNAENINTILINGVECEPYLTTDYVAAKKYAKEVVLGAKYLMKATGAVQAVIAIKKGREEAEKALKAAIGDSKTIELLTVKDAYPMGWERLLIKTVFHEEYDKLPTEVGIVVTNIQSVISVATTLSTGHPVAARLVTVSGEGIKNPANVLVPLGTLATQLIAACGGYTATDVNVIPGGIMTGKPVMFDKFAIGLTNGAVTVLVHETVTSDACLRCGACIANCPMHLQPVEIKNCYDSKDTARMEKLQIMNCVECGMCSYVCPSKIEVTEGIRKAKLIYKLQHK